MTDAVKRPAGGAYMQWLNQTRNQIQEICVKEGKGMGAPVIAKHASGMWKELSDADKAPFVKMYEAQKAAYDAYKASDSFEPPAKKAKTGDKPLKKERDADAPKRLVGGAYGMFQNANRAEFTKEAAAKGETGFGAGTKLGGERWKALTEAQQGEWQAKYQEAKAQYDVDFKAYQQRKEIADSLAPAKSPAESPAKTPAKSLSKSAQKPPSAKRDRPSPKAELVIEKGVLEEAQKLGYDGLLRNLAGRSDVTGTGASSQKMLDALKESGGLVNQAKQALLGA